MVDLPTLLGRQQLPGAAGVVVRRRSSGTIISLSHTDVPARRKIILLMLTLAGNAAAGDRDGERARAYNGIRHSPSRIPPMTVLAGLALRLGRTG